MQLTLWTYEGPPHVGAMRVATALRGVHYVLHAPQGDTYADLLFTMIERRPERPPVTYTTFQARDLGGDTAQLFKDAVKQAYDRFQPQAMLVGASCTAELIQDDPGGLAAALDLPIPVIPLELPAYQRKENWGAAETFYQLVRTLVVKPQASRVRGAVPRCNVLGPTALGFRHRDDLREITQLLQQLGIEINVVAPWQATPADLARLADADFNVVLYPEVAQTAAAWLRRQLGQPSTTIIPIGARATQDFIEEVSTLAGLGTGDGAERHAVRVRDLAAGLSRSPWYARSVDSNYLTGKRVFIFGDATHAIAAARVATEEFGFELVGLGSYSREFGRELRAAAAHYGLEALITDDYLEVEAAISAATPELVLGTQMERHMAKRLGVPCAVISAPVHVQDFPARHAPQMGFEGANVLFDTWVHPLMMGLEEHLLGMFRGDFEFHADALPSHLGHAARPVSMASRDAPMHEATEAATGEPTGEAMDAAIAVQTAPIAAPRPIEVPPQDAPWSADAEQELRKIPFFVRAKARRNTEAYARSRQLPLITLETLYDAKAHFSR
ncbi:ferredoxin:protochlorophyllide reductase (ATP-dependent) subunit B [Roseateles depolymerans]|uniref:Light-independent protochlorophyllide reductase subunit B n=1 Tax=Roseateles depolymerans TaxID=76731 RepID=A0A0U3MRD0_9BURK|nr:ferredoxin:protochlorophyllide reductase (ATP-dependent) subunit B [Roseateles depolymerans]ALV05507.1 Light-independent protochlorophyllide reductase subunit B [Roseateles depolymerans]REG14474.1 ferredoxin protochlorophyllide reductase subunit B [Roseateles depolymerans]